MQKKLIGKISLIVAAVILLTALGFIIFTAKPTEKIPEQGGVPIVPNEYIVSFVTQCDDVIADQTVLDGQKVTKPSNPTKVSSTEDYKFEGWYNGEDVWDFENDVVTGDITLVACWSVENSYTDDYILFD